MILPKGRIKRVHVNRHFIASNKQGGNKPVFTVKCGGKSHYARRVVFEGPAELIYRPEKPMSCGAVAWIESRGELTLIDSMTHAEAKEL